MLSKEELYGTAARLASEEKLLKNANISETNRSLLTDFMNHNLAKGISTFRVIKYDGHLRKIAVWAEKDLDKCDKKDIERVMAAVNKNNYSEDTVEDYKSTLKVYYRFVKGLERNDAAPDCVRWITRKKPESKLKRESLVMPDQVDRIVMACDNPRDKCMIAMLFECGLRPGELRSISLSDITRKTNDAGAQYYKICVSGKTGGGDVFLMINAEHLTRWWNAHPCATDNNAPLFVNTYGNVTKVISNSTLYEIVKIASRKALGRSIYPYVLRHSAATFWTLKMA